VFVLNKEENRITKVKSCCFSKLGFNERGHLQEWLESNPEALSCEGDEDGLLYIQKEFDGFKETRERLDLLAIDKKGNLVVIENKLDDSGKDVTWQALKYASYCSSLSKKQIKSIYQDYLNKKGIHEKSEDNIAEFLNVEDFEEVQLNQSQRIVLVAGNYRKEVTSTVLWLLTKYNLKIQCFKATPYELGGQIFLNIEQIIPVKEIEEYTIRMAEKAKEEQCAQYELEERHKLRVDFWKKLLQTFNQKSSLFSNVNVSKDNWIAAGSGISGVGIHFVVSKSYARTEVYISRSVAKENKFIYDELYKQKDLIEKQTGALEWERLDNKKASRIKKELKNVNIYEKDDWIKMINFMVENMLKMETIFHYHPIFT